MKGLSAKKIAVDRGLSCLGGGGVAVLRSVLEYNVAWLDITPFLPICLVQLRAGPNASFKDNIPSEALQFPRVVRVEDRRSGLCMSIVNKGRTLSEHIACVAGP